MAQSTWQSPLTITKILGILYQGTSMQVLRMSPIAFPGHAYNLTSKQQTVSALHDLALLSSEGVVPVDVTGGATDEFEADEDPARLAADKLSRADG